MTGMILCRTKMAKNPYHAAHAGLNLYSLEELCYYIYHNIYLIGFDLVDEPLIAFIRTELEEEALAVRLEYLKKNRAGLAEMVITILKYVDYYDNRELEEIREILETLDTQNVYERLKRRADSLLGNKKYAGAIKNYLTILDGEKDPLLPGIFYAGVYHNLGVAYGNLFLYPQAREAFIAAYAIGQHEESKKCIVAAELLDENFHGPRTFGSEDEESFVFEREVETVLDNGACCPECREIDVLEKQHGEGDRGYYENMEAIIERWKQEHIRYTS